MDLLNEIKLKAERFPKDYRTIGIEAVLLHIETAEKYFKRAKEESDENLYTDVIYRTNHAYEGILKEAYLMFADKESENINPYEIENYFLDNNIFNDRVLNLFSNYRKEWRNVSTHDYKLFFSAQEAFLAIVNVSAFVIILLDQIIEKINSLIEKQKIEKKIKSIISKIDRYDSLPFHDKIRSLLIQFYTSEKSEIDSGINESELVGKIIGFLGTIDSDLLIERDNIVEYKHGKFQIDLIVSKNNEKVVVEIKRIGSAFYDLHRPEQQLLNYLYITKIQNGILFVYRPGTEGIKAWTQPDLGLMDKQYSVTTVAPKELCPNIALTLSGKQERLAN